MRPFIAALMGAFLVGCALLSEETQTLCDTAGDAIETYYDAFPDGDLAATQAAVDACLAAWDVDSKNWNIEWEKLMQIIDDLRNQFGWFDIFDADAKSNRADASAVMRLYLNDLRK